ncbi:MAG TPA: hypothetical protein VGV38_03565 [Pyrinomonadaceae bacterium]|nr:hypothetical protein [Pyrinomonadaceae bacterium]
MIEFLFALVVLFTAAGYGGEAETEPTLCSAPTRIETVVNEQGQVCQQFTDLCTGTVTVDCDGE